MEQVFCFLLRALHTEGLLVSLACPQTCPQGVGGLTPLWRSSPAQDFPEIPFSLLFQLDSGILSALSFFQDGNSESAKKYTQGSERNQKWGFIAGLEKTPPPLLGQSAIELAFSGRGAAKAGFPAVVGSPESVHVMQY